MKKLVALILAVYAALCLSACGPLGENKPVFSGLEDMEVEKYSSPDYTRGVSVRDGAGKELPFTYDASKVNPAVPGTYYVTYYAGNGLEKRTVVVKPDQSDVEALAAEIAAKLADDPEMIRNYVRSTIRYSHDWGGETPVWYGFQNHRGNCYVHALCLKSLLDIKGYHTLLIWTEDRTHYWLMIELEGGWKHIDATPGRLHSRYSLMNDTQRLETLYSDGHPRRWDRTAWPESP